MRFLKRLKSSRDSRSWRRTRRRKAARSPRELNTSMSLTIPSRGRLLRYLKLRSRLPRTMWITREQWTWPKNRMRTMIFYSFRRTSKKWVRSSCTRHWVARVANTGKRLALMYLNTITCCRITVLHTWSIRSLSSTTSSTSSTSQWKLLSTSASPSIRVIQWRMPTITSSTYWTRYKPCSSSWVSATCSSSSTPSTSSLLS